MDTEREPARTNDRTYPKMEEMKIWRSTFLVIFAPLLLHADAKARLIW